MGGQVGEDPRVRLTLQFGVQYSTMTRPRVSRFAGGLKLCRRARVSDDVAARVNLGFHSGRKLRFEKKDVDEETACQPSPCFKVECWTMLARRFETRLSNIGYRPGARKRGVLVIVTVIPSTNVAFDLSSRRYTTAVSSHSRQTGPYQRSVFLVAIHKRPSDSSSHESWMYRYTNTDSVGDETISVFSVHSLPLNANAS